MKVRRVSRDLREVKTSVATAVCAVICDNPRHKPARLRLIV